MIVDLVDKLIDRCIQLIKHHQKIRRDMLEDYVTPIFGDIETLHKDYLKSFLKYRNILKSSNEEFNLSHPLFDVIHEDSLFGQGDREKLWKLINYSNVPILGKFVFAISNYLRFALEDTEYLIRDPYIYSNVYRARLFEGLDQIFESDGSNEDKRREAIKVVDDITKSLQDNYSLVVDEYSALRNTLLS